jgi:hypothetical protein
MRSVNITVSWRRSASSCRVGSVFAGVAMSGGAGVELRVTGDGRASAIGAIRADTRPVKLQALGLAGQTRTIVQAPSEVLQHSHHHSRELLRRGQVLGCRRRQLRAVNPSIL